MEKICTICEETFSNHSAYANHIRWKHKDNTEYAKKIREKALERSESQYGKIIKETSECRKCGKPLEITYREGKKKQFYHCSRECANSRGARTSEFKEILSAKIRKKWKDGHYDSVDYTSKNKRFSSKKEREIVQYFKEKYPEDEWKSGGGLRFMNYVISRDLYSDRLKVCFEYDGVWHFKDIHGQLEKKQEKDAILENWCITNGYRLIRIEETSFENFEQIENLIYNSVEPVQKIGDSYQ